MWEQEFDERARKEITFSRLYAADFHHGTEGHNAKLIIAKMAELLDLTETPQGTPSVALDAKAGPPSSDIAASAYRAYGFNRDWKDWRGQPMPQWNELPAHIRTAWEAAVRQVWGVFNGGSYGLDIEAHWKDWTPPKG